MPTTAPDHPRSPGCRDREVDRSRAAALNKSPWLALSLKLLGALALILVSTLATLANERFEHLASQFNSLTDEVRALLQKVDSVATNVNSVSNLTGILAIRAARNEDEIDKLRNQLGKMQERQ